MGVLAWRARAGAMVLAAAVAVHQLVYGLAGVRPDAGAHAYLDWLTPALFALLFVSVAEVVLRVLGVHRQPAAPPPRARVLWPVLSVLLAGTFAAQEAAEVLLASGDAHGHALRELLVGHGLWLAGPVSALVAAILALALRGAATADAWSLRIANARPAAAPAPLAPRAPRADARVPRDVAASHLAGRGPPLAVV